MARSLCDDQIVVFSDRLYCIFLVATVHLVLPTCTPLLEDRLWT